MRARPGVLTAVACLTLVAAGCTAGADPPAGTATSARPGAVPSAATRSPQPQPQRRRPAGRPGGDGDRLAVVAVGDIADCAPPGCPSARTAALARGMDPDAVLALGDTQHPSGALADYS